MLLTMSVAAPDALPIAPMRLVFLAMPGPGGGGGGGGSEAARAAAKGQDERRSRSA